MERGEKLCTNARSYMAGEKIKRTLKKTSRFDDGFHPVATKKGKKNCEWLS